MKRFVIIWPSLGYPTFEDANEIRDKYGKQDLEIKEIECPTPPQPRQEMNG